MREAIRDIPRIEHMIEAIDNAMEYTSSFNTKEEFVSNKAMLHATIYNTMPPSPSALSHDTRSDKELLAEALKEKYYS